MKEAVEVMRLFPQQRLQQCTVKDIFHLPVPHAQEQIMAVGRVFPQTQLSDRLGEQNVDNHFPQHVEEFLDDLPLWASVTTCSVFRSSDSGADRGSCQVFPQERTSVW